MELIQYQIVLVNLDPTVSSEIKKTRPCVIISPDEMNKHLQTVVIAPVTSTSKNYPTRVELKGHKTKGWIVLDLVRTIDRIRVIKQIEETKLHEVVKIKAVIKETYVD